MKTIVINNPAARSGGALTILKETLKKISSIKCSHKFFIFVSLDELRSYESENLKIFVIPPQGSKNRILWDNFGLKNYLKNKDIKPDFFISIQNTGVNLPKKIPQIIYYHQPLSVVDLKWNPLKKEERLFWMYKNIYPIFIKQYLSRVKKVIVQTEWVKECFNKKFSYPLNNIFLIKPKIDLPKVDEIKLIPKEKFRIFYPATPIIYKNHKIIIEALAELKKENSESVDNLECIFTFSKGENLSIDQMISRSKLENTIKLIGKIPYKKVLEYYKSSDLVVFPSYLETFGLPLIEGKHFNLPILTVDLPYAKEVTYKYKKVKLIKYNKVEEWKKEIKRIVD